MNRARQPGCSATSETPLKRCVAEELDRYFDALEGEQPCDLYRMVIRETEQALLQYVLAHTGGNQCRAAELLGMNRGTLRKKLDFYGIGR
jgi:Fis family transcriptional regulator